MHEFQRRTICISLTPSIISYILGAILAFILHVVAGFLFLILIFGNLLVSMRFRCTSCWYYGKLCFNGFGWFAANVFPQQPETEFQEKSNLIITVLFDVILLLYPVIISIILLIQQFRIGILLLLICYFLVSTLPNFIIRPRMCVHCEQGKQGCPVYEQSKSKSNK